MRGDLSILDPIQMAQDNHVGLSEAEDEAEVPDVPAEPHGGDHRGEDRRHELVRHVREVCLK